MMSMSATRRTGYFGIAAAFVYVATTASGSLIDPSYSQVGQHVSDLTATDAPTRAALAAPYLLYNLLAFGMACSLWFGLARSRPALIGASLMTINSLAGIMMVTFFTEDLGGPPRTFAGYGHVGFAAASSLAIVLAAVVYGFAFRGARAWRSLSAF